MKEIEYSRKYNSKYKKDNRHWIGISPKHTITPTDWKVFDIRINGVIYKSPSKEFLREYGKIKMWNNLNDRRI